MSLEKKNGGVQALDVIMRMQRGCAENNKSKEDKIKSLKKRGTMGNNVTGVMAGAEVDHLTIT